MGNKSMLWIPITYLLFITAVNVCFLVWTNYESYKYNITIIEEQEKISKENESKNQSNQANNTLNDMNKSLEESFHLADPIINAGKRAEKALPVFVLGVFGGVFVSILTFLPSWVKEYIDNFIKDFYYKDMDWHLIRLYEWGVFFANVALTFFQVVGATGLFDFGSAIANW